MRRRRLTTTPTRTVDAQRRARFHTAPNPTNSEHEAPSGPLAGHRVIELAGISHPDGLKVLPIGSQQHVPITVARAPVRSLRPTDAIASTDGPAGPERRYSLPRPAPPPGRHAGDFGTANLPDRSILRETVEQWRELRTQP